MLRINLLPAYIAERKKTRTALILASLLWLAVLGGFLGYQFAYLAPAVAAKEAEATDRQAEADRVTKIGADAKAERDRIIPIKEKVDFVEAVRYANIVRQKIYRNAARYTYRSVEYNQMAVNADALTVAGFVKNTDDLGRFYLTMFGNPDVTAVSIQGIPAYEGTPALLNPSDPSNVTPATAGWFPVQLSATLVKPVVTPALPASLAEGGGGAGSPTGFSGSNLTRPSTSSGPPRGSSGPPAGYGGPSTRPSGGASTQAD